MLRLLPLLPGVAALLLAACSSLPEPRPFPRPFHVIAHRGASGYAPESTLPAYQKALELGIVEVEFDVQLTADGEVVLFHDGLLETKTGLPGAVADHTWQELRQADIGAWFDGNHPDAKETWAGTRLVSLDELLSSFGRSFHYHVEIKSAEEALPAKVLAALRRFDLLDRVTLTSFRIEQLRRVRRLDAEVPTTFLVRSPAPGDIERAAEERLTGVGIRVDNITPELVASARRHGLEARAYGVLTDEDIARAIGAGANGMTIDHPDRLIRRVLEHLRSGGED